MQKYTPRAAHLALLLSATRCSAAIITEIFIAPEAVFAQKFSADVNSLALLQIVRAGAHPDLHYELRR